MNVRPVCRGNMRTKDLRPANVPRRREIPDRRRMPEECLQSAVASHNGEQMAATAGSFYNARHLETNLKEVVAFSPEVESAVAAHNGEQMTATAGSFSCQVCLEETD